MQLLTKYATLFRPEGSQQTDFAVQEDTPSTESITKRSQGLHELFQPNSGSPGKASVSGGDSTTINFPRATEHNDDNITRTANNSSTEDQNSERHFCEKLSQDRNGTATRSPNRGHLPLQGGNLERDRLHESSTSWKNTQRSQSPTNRRLGQAATCQPDESDCINLQNEENIKNTTTRATQISLKQRELGTHPPYVVDNEEADLLIFNFVQSIVQQTQQHIFKQLKQCMQQAYSGLSLGTPVHAKEYTEKF